ncbi:MAG TPA: DUF4129 domain-containing protein [Pyrinomonadaceae bacterium]|nr:DUF4129 domain-containing protein [Pyrinomonadaceae bacterium]
MKTKRLKKSKALLSPLFAAFVLVFLFSLNSFAKTVAEYQKGVEKAILGVGELVGHLYDIKEGISDPDAAFEKNKLTEIRNALPATERIEWQGAVVETDNQWLNEKLDEFAEESFNSPKREPILIEISERLSSLSVKLKELEKPSNSAARSKDEDKQKLSEILNREEYQKPEEKKKSLFEEWYEKILKWFEDLFPRPNVPTVNPDSATVSSLSYVFQILLYIVVIGIAAFIIYKFAPFFFKKFKKREKREKKERVILGEKIAANEDATTIFDEAESLAQQGNLRDAIRKGYIALLCELSDRKLIGLAHYKTNRDYLRDVRKKREIYNGLSGLTNSFEKHWYGFETVDETDWSEFREKYKETVSTKQT